MDPKNLNPNCVCAYVCICVHVYMCMCARVCVCMCACGASDEPRASPVPGRYCATALCVAPASHSVNEH